MSRTRILATFATTLLLVAAFLGSLGCNQPATVQTASPGPSTQGYTAPPPGYSAAASGPAASSTPPGRGFGNTIYASKSTAHMVASPQSYNAPGYNTPGYSNQGWNAPAQATPGHSGPGYNSPSHSSPGYSNQGYSNQGSTPPGRGFGYTLRVVKNTSHMLYRGY